MENLIDQIDFFFREPNEIPNEKEYSILYLLRRDIFTCFGHDPNTMEHIPYQAMWPGVMGILAGIDLLGKYLEGDDVNTTVTDRFKKYYLRYFNDDETEADAIYQLRNSMLHSFGLYSFKLKNKIKIKEYFFILDRRNNNQIVSVQKEDWYIIDIVALCNSFEN